MRYRYRDIVARPQQLATQTTGTYIKWARLSAQLLHLRHFLLQNHIRYIILLYACMCVFVVCVCVCVFVHMCVHACAHVIIFVIVLVYVCVPNNYAFSGN